ncbi:GL16366 [Drosophila persimilis]|uniref:GL16366 n=1 Tax=Drosophila persimilis TaxID=7234 RepID=B4IS61_DROPE|nr:GL16366 [Drosophila persimilis]
MHYEIRWLSLVVSLKDLYIRNKDLYEGCRTCPERKNKKKLVIVETKIPPRHQPEASTSAEAVDIGSSSPVLARPETWCENSQRSTGTKESSGAGEKQTTIKQRHPRD